MKLIHLFILATFFITPLIALTTDNRPSWRAVIVYDNNAGDPRLKTDWGFSCYLEGPEKTILFDCGGRGDILLSNLEKLGLSPQKIEVICLSHFHQDHVGGLEDFLIKNAQVEVWLPYFFPSDFKKAIVKKGARVIEVAKPAPIGHGLYTSGVIDGPIREQSLVLDTREGLVVITGCAHPGIVHILEEIKTSFPKKFYMVIGGFHLAGLPEIEIKKIVAEFRRLGIRKVGPTHCSGDAARRLFSEEYGLDYINPGLGREVIIQ
ncbi:MAG: MBL fold metallo-hydrolase [Candidatus Aminicenantes bacterium]|nr:MBL fold metallo-hydrolase [Candidatus Aminicenantes bacterium]